MRKKFLAAIVCAALMLSLAGCDMSASKFEYGIDDSNRVVITGYSGEIGRAHV